MNVADALIEITGNNSPFVLVKLLPLQVDSSMSPVTDTKPSTLRVMQLLQSCEDLRSNLSFGEPSVLLHSSRMLSQCEKLVKPNGAKCASRDNNSDVHIINHQKQKKKEKL